MVDGIILFLVLGIGVAIVLWVLYALLSVERPRTPQQKADRLLLVRAQRHQRRADRLATKSIRGGRRARRAAARRWILERNADRRI